MVTGPTSTRTLMANTLAALDRYGWAAGGLIDMDGRVCLTAAVCLGDGYDYRWLEALGKGASIPNLHRTYIDPYTKVHMLATPLHLSPLAPLFILAMDHPTWHEKQTEYRSTGSGLHPADSLWVYNDSPLTTEEDVRLLVKRAMEAN